jgi:hypothetical protein
MKRGSKKNLPLSQNESDEQEPTIADIFNAQVYISDFTDLIDVWLDKAAHTKGVEKKEALIAADEMMTFYEKYVGRKIYTHPI